MTKKRFNILALIFVTVVINYMDRSNISVAAAAIGEDLSLTKVQLGLIFSAFGLTYSLAADSRRNYGRLREAKDTVSDHSGVVVAGHPYSRD